MKKLTIFSFVICLIIVLRFVWVHWPWEWHEEIKEFLLYEQEIEKIWGRQWDFCGNTREKIYILKPGESNYELGLGLTSSATTSATFKREVIDCYKKELIFRWK